MLILKHVSGSNRWFARAFATKYVPTVRYSSTLYSMEESPILRDLNPNQIEAVTQPVDHSITRVIAGPGSGKTRVLTSRIAYLLNNTRSDRILGVTFTKKAAGEMQARLDALVRQLDDTAVPTSTRRVTLGTFHSVCSRILRKQGVYLAGLPSIQKAMENAVNATNLDGSFTILDQTGQLRVVKESLEDQNIDLKDHKDIKPIQLLNNVAKIKSELALNKPNPLQSKKHLPKAMKVAGQIYPTYREKLISNNCVDFDDLIQLTRELLLHHDNVREELRSVWPHVLIDEFQDTSQSQMDLVKLLTSTTGSLFVVGDADQSIYSWRGAHHGSLSDFEKEFRNCGQVSTVYLMENYRSTSSIVKAAQKVIAASGKSSDADKLRQNMIPQRDAGAAPRIVACADAKTEAEFVVKTVKDSISARKYNPNHTVAFIYRTNAQSRALEEACVQMGQPYVIFGSATSFYKRQEVKDCLCFLRWLYNGRDRESMLRAITTPKRGIGDTAIAEFDRYCDAVGIYFHENYPGSPRPTPLDVLYLLSSDTSWCSHEIQMCPPPSSELSTRPLKLFEAFSKQMIKIRDVARGCTVEQVLSAIVVQFEIIPHLDKISKSKEEFEERQANVNELRQASRRYDAEGPALPSQLPVRTDIAGSPLENFLDDVALVTEMADSSQESDGRFVVNLMTIHASKGLEFDSVFFVGLEDGTIPTSQALQEGQDSVEFQEEKRLCYVAMTRAKSELVMSWRKAVPIFTAEGMTQKKGERSRFLDSLMKSSKTAKKQANGQNEASAARISTTDNRSSYVSKRQYSGTTSVFSQQKRTFSSAPQQPRTSARVPLNGEQRRISESSTPCSPPRTSLTRSSSVRVEHGIVSDNPARSPEAVTKKDNRPRNNRITPFASGNKPENSSLMDSTWFFPVGSEVQHRKHGKGIVLPCPPSNDGMLVRVRFKNGDEHQFSVHGSDISPVIL